MTSLLIIASCKLEAEVLRRGLRHMADWQILGFASIGRPCGLIVRDARPDVILVSHTAPADDMCLRVAEARQAAPRATIVCRTPRTGDHWAHATTAAGADATIDAALDARRVGVLMRELAAGSVFCAPRDRAAEPSSARPASSVLTNRELQILRLVAAGASNNSIAGRLWVTEQTVKFHLSNIYRKLGVANRTSASHYAHTHGFLTDDPLHGPPVGNSAVAA